MIDPLIAAAFQPYLQSGERIVWTGRPRGGWILRPADALLIPFSMIWGGFAFFWEASVLRVGPSALATPMGAVFPLFGLPFVAMGLYFIVGRFAVDAWVRKKTVYGLSNQRALLLRRLKGDRLVARPLGGELKLTGQTQRYGSLTFGQPANPFFQMNGFKMWTPALTDEVAFMEVEGVMEAYRLAGDQRSVSAPAP